MDKWTFKTVYELAEFVKKFEEQPEKVLHVSYANLTATLKDRPKNRKFENESTIYIYKDDGIGTSDSLSEMRRAETNQNPHETKWMLKMPKNDKSKGE